MVGGPEKPLVQRSDVGMVIREWNGRANDAAADGTPMDGQTMVSQP